MLDWYFAASETAPLRELHLTQPKGILELRKDVLGERHPDAILAMANLASTWWQQGQSDKAEQLLGQVIELRKSVLGNKHLDTVNAIEYLAYIRQRRFSRN